MLIFLRTIAIAVHHAFEQGTGPVFLDNVRCIGNESSLLSCSHGTCSRNSGAGVVCPPCKWCIWVVLTSELPSQCMGLVLATMDITSTVILQVYTPDVHGERTWGRAKLHTRRLTTNLALIRQLVINNPCSVSYSLQTFCYFCALVALYSLAIWKSISSCSGFAHLHWIYYHHYLNKKKQCTYEVS